MFQENNVVQFNEKHKWCGCIGIINEVKQCNNEDIRYLIGVLIPEQGTAFIFSMGSEDEFELIGNAIFVLDDDKE